MFRKLYGASVGVFIAVIAFSAGQACAVHNSKSLLIELGCGQYDAKTGEFQHVKVPEAVDVMALKPLPIRKPQK